jgi:hypothetical protein
MELMSFDNLSMACADRFLKRDYSKTTKGSQ